MIRKLGWSLVVFAALLLASCDDDEEDKNYKYMEGDIEYTLPDYCIVGDVIEVSLEGEGITDPADVEYNWIFDGDTTLNTKTLRIEIPDSAAVYWVSCFARYDKYVQVTNTQSVQALDTAFNGSVHGLAPGTATFTDPRDNRSYQYRQIGNLDWFVENLAYRGAGVAYQKNDLMSDIYGRYYSWNDATGGESRTGLGNGPQGCCPEGWSVPTAEDWADLALAVSEGQVSDFYTSWPQLGSVLSVEAYENAERMWPYSPDHKHRNTYGWNAFPAGNTQDSYLRFLNKNEYGMWWSSTQCDEQTAYYRYIYYNQPDCLVHFVDKAAFGVMVRCVRMAQ